MARKTALTPSEKLVDSVRIKQEDGSEWLLLPNLELRMLKAPRRGRSKTVSAEVSGPQLPLQLPTGSS